MHAVCIKLIYIGVKFYSFYKSYKILLYYIIKLFIAFCIKSNRKYFSYHENFIHDGGKSDKN